MKLYKNRIWRCCWDGVELPQPKYGTKQGHNNFCGRLCEKNYENFIRRLTGDAKNITEALQTIRGKLLCESLLFELILRPNAKLLNEQLKGICNEIKYPDKDKPEPDIVDRILDDYIKLHNLPYPLSSDLVAESNIIEKRKQNSQLAVVQ